MFQSLSFLLQVSLKLNLLCGSASFYLRANFTKYSPADAVLLLGA